MSTESEILRDVVLVDSIDFQHLAGTYFMKEEKQIWPWNAIKCFLQCANASLNNNNKERKKCNLKDLNCYFLHQLPLTLLSTLPHLALQWNLNPLPLFHEPQSPFLCSYSFPSFPHFFKVENVKWLDRVNPRKSSEGTLHLTATHLIFVDNSRKKETWVSYNLLASVIWFNWIKFDQVWIKKCFADVCHNKVC